MASKLRILVVDDDRDFADSLAELLREQSHEVDTAYSGEQGVERFRQNDYCLTLMDIRLPGKSGVDCLAEIRALKSDARVFLVTGFSGHHLIERAIGEGAYGVMHKPLDVNNLLGVISQIKPSAVLVADDDTAFVADIRHLLQQGGYRVLVAGNGRDVIRRVSAGGVDALVLDLRLPELNGWEVYQELQRLGQCPPTIVVTAYAKEEAAAIAKLTALSVAGVLTKPFDPARLLAAIDKLIAAPR